jgi:AbrB family looped-hinge helix DNA binding protein
LAWLRLLAFVSLSQNANPAAAANSIDQSFVIPCYDRSMETVTISPKFQIVIPKSIRERLKLRAGQKVQAIAYQDRIELVPVRPARAMKGFVKGIDTNVVRESDRL